MANPNPEVAPEEIEDVVAVVGTGRSDYPNQINNVLAFPGVFRGALDVRASAITREMELAAAHALADVVDAEHLAADYVLPSVFDRTVAPAVAAAVARGRRGERRGPAPADTHARRRLERCGSHAASARAMSSVESTPTGRFELGRRR